MANQYSTVQKLSLAGMLVGAVMVVVGAGSPYWLVSDPQGSAITSLLSKLVKGYMGLFMVCIKMVGQEDCRVLESDDRDGWFHVARLTAAVCVLLGMVCGAVSLCLACCTCCKRFIVVGILAFFAAASGAACCITFSKNTEVFTSSLFDYKLVSYGWGFYLFGAGVGVLGVVSICACFSAPDNPVRGMILSQPQMIIHSANPNPYLNLQEQHEINVVNPPGPPNVTVVSTNGY